MRTLTDSNGLEIKIYSDQNWKMGIVLGKSKSTQPEQVIAAQNWLVLVRSYENA